MTAKLFLALYVGLFVGMFILFFANFALAWILFVFLFVAVFGGLAVANRPYLIAAGFLLTFLIVLGLGAWDMYQSSQASAWPRAPGVITRSWFCTRTVNGDVVYSGPCIEYSYTVNKQTYEASSIDTGEFAQAGWINIPEKYKQGREINVYYNANQPGISRLGTDIPLGLGITVGVSGIMAALAAFTLVRVLWTRGITPLPDPPVSFVSGQAVHVRRPVKPHKTVSMSTVPDIGDQLQKLAELHDKQELSDEEYERAKKRLLGEP